MHPRALAADRLPFVFPVVPPSSIAASSSGTASRWASCAGWQLPPLVFGGLSSLLFRASARRLGFQVLLDFLAVEGYEADKYEVHMSFPRHSIGATPQEAARTFEEVGLTKRAALHVTER